MISVDLKNCEKCNLPFTPKKSNTRFCYRVDCQKSRQKDRWQKWYDKEDSRLKMTTYQRHQRLATRRFSSRHWELKSRYGIGIDYWVAMLENAAYQCEVCTSEKDLVCDHDHNTGIIRGVLCRKCNAGLGNIGDTLDNARKLVKYLEERTHGIPALMDRVFSEDGTTRFEQGCLFTETGGGDSYVTWQSTDKRRVQWHKVWNPPLR